EQLIESMTGAFDATEYRDEYREALMGVIEAKVAGEEPRRAEKAEPTKIGDLMAALEASVAAAREGRRAGAEGKAEAEVEPKPAAASRRRAAKEPAKAPSRSTRSRSAAARDEAQEEKPARRRKTA
ncbi:MAG: Ku protein, partial [Candidatus Limnocylindrales bacterium]